MSVNVRKEEYLELANYPELLEEDENPTSEKSRRISFSELCPEILKEDEKPNVFQRRIELYLRQKKAHCLAILKRD